MTAPQIEMDRLRAELEANKALVAATEMDAARWRAYQQGKVDPIAELNVSLLRASKEALDHVERLTKALEAADSKWRLMNDTANQQAKNAEYYHDQVISIIEAVRITAERATADPSLAVLLIQRLAKTLERA